MNKRFKIRVSGCIETEVNAEDEGEANEMVCQYIRDNTLDWDWCFDEIKEIACEEAIKKKTYNPRRK